MSTTDGRAAGRAHAIKLETRAETGRKAKERESVAMTAFVALGAIGIIVAAMTGPWKEKLETTSTGRVSDTAAISAVREVLASKALPLVAIRTVSI